MRRATLRDVETRLIGSERGLFGNWRGQRFDAEFEGLTLQGEEGTRLRVLLPGMAHAAWDSELSLKGTLDGAPFKIEMERDDEGSLSGSVKGVVFASASEAQGFVESFISARPDTKLTLDGYADGRRIRVTLKSGRVTLIDRGAGTPARQALTIAADDPLEVRVWPATLEDVNATLLGEEGLVPRGRRFEAQFEDLTLAARDVEPFVTLLRAALRARPRSTLELKGTLEDKPFTAKLDLDREGRGRLQLADFIFASNGEVNSFLARFEGCGGVGGGNAHRFSGRPHALAHPREAMSSSPYPRERRAAMISAGVARTSTADAGAGAVSYAPGSDWSPPPRTGLRAPSLPASGSARCGAARRGT